MKTATTTTATMTPTAFRVAELIERPGYTPGGRKEPPRDESVHLPVMFALTNLPGGADEFLNLHRNTGSHDHHNARHRQRDPRFRGRRGNRFPPRVRHPRAALTRAPA